MMKYIIAFIILSAFVAYCVDNDAWREWAKTNQGNIPGCPVQSTNFDYCGTISCVVSNGQLYVYKQ